MNVDVNVAVVVNVDVKNYSNFRDIWYAYYRVTNHSNPCLITPSLTTPHNPQGWSTAAVFVS